MSEPAAPLKPAGRKHPLAIPLLIVICGVALGLVVRDTNTLLILLLILGAAFLMHLVTARLTEVDLLIPFIIGVGSLAIALWWFAPESFDLSRQFDEHAPAPVKRLVTSTRGLFSGPGTVGDGGSDAARGAASSFPPRSAEMSRAPSSRTAPQQPITAAADRPSGAVSLTVAQPTVKLGEPVALTVFVRSSSENSVQRCGRLYVFDSASRIKTAVLKAENHGCTAVLTIDDLDVGTHVLTARYAGTGTSASTSSAVSVTVLPPR